MNSRALLLNRFLILLSSLLLLAGCGESSDPLPSSASDQRAAAPVGTIVVQQTLLQAIPADVTRQRFLGFDSQGEVRFGPTLHDKAATITLNRVSTAVTRLQIQYLRGDEVVGLGSVPVLVSQGQVTTVRNPPFQDFQATIASVRVDPAQASVAAGTQQRFTAVATLSDGSLQDVTAVALWTTQTPTVATVQSAGEEQPGLASTLRAGQTSVTATLGAVNGTATLTVTNATLAKLSITPDRALSAPGSRRQYTATASFSDGSSQDVTSQASWSSNDPSVLISNDSWGSNARGRATVDKQAPAGRRVTVTATLNGSSATSTLTLGAFAYVANSADGSVSSFILDPTSGSLSGGSAVPTGSAPSSLAVHPWGRLLYVANTDSNTLSKFSIDPQTGVLTGGASVPTHPGPRAMVVHPGGRFLYLAHLGGGEVSVYPIDPETGALGQASSITAGTFPSSLALDPSGRYLFVANQLSATISRFAVNPDTGLLTDLGTVPTGEQPVSLTIHPNGRFAYTANVAGGSISRFDVSAADGALIPRGDTAVGDFAYLLALDPTGRFGYVTSPGGQMRSFLIAPDTGALVNGFTENIGNALTAAAIYPDGRYVVFADRVNNVVFSLAINALTGELSNATSVPTGNTPAAITLTP